MTISFREIADQCDAYDQEVADITEARKDFWADVRDQLPARDVRALKAAIKARKRRRADLDGEEDHDQRTAEILAEIEAGTNVALAHARRASDPPHDPTTGEILEPGHEQSSPVGEELPSTSLKAPPLHVDASLAISNAPHGVASEEGADAIALNASSSQINTEFLSQNTPMIGEGQAVGALSDGHVDGSQACLPSDRAENKPCATVVIAGAPSNPAAGAAEQGLGTAPNSMPGPDLSQSGGALTPDAPVEQSPSRDVAPGAPIPCEANGWAGLEPLPQFDRRRPAA